jgi:endonuclease YncB( thermonuclease family)
MSKKVWQTASFIALLSALLVPLTGLAASNPAGVPKSATAYTVYGHIDGDSFYVEDGSDRQQIDLLGVDAPELKKKGDSECYAQEAADQLEKLLPEDSTVYLEDEGIDKDGSDQGLPRDVWIEGKDGKKATLINTKQVREGFVGSKSADAEHPRKYQDRLSDAQDEAREAERGLWETCTGIHTHVVPTPVPSPTPSPTASVDEIKTQYAPLADVRELAIRPGGMMGQKIFFYGTILSIDVATPGYVFTLGDNDPQQYGVELQVTVSAPDGSTEVVFVGSDGDTTGMFEGSWVVVFGTVVDTETFQNALGGYVSQPLVAAQFVELA